MSRGDRIAQLVIQPVTRATFIAVAALEETPRGARGHGSTGGMPADADPASRSAVPAGQYAASAEGVNR